MASEFSQTLEVNVKLSMKSFDRRYLEILMESHDFPTGSEPLSKCKVGYKIAWKGVPAMYIGDTV